MTLTDRWLARQAVFDPRENTRVLAQVASVVVSACDLIGQRYAWLSAVRAKSVVPGQSSLAIKVEHVVLCRFS